MATLHKLQPHKIKTTQKLENYDPKRRIDFWEIMINSSIAQAQLIKHISFSDESTSYSSDKMNK